MLIILREDEKYPDYHVNTPRKPQDYESRLLCEVPKKVVERFLRAKKEYSDAEDAISKIYFDELRKKPRPPITSEQFNFCKIIASQRNGPLDLEIVDVLTRGSPMFEGIEWKKE